LPTGRTYSTPDGKFPSITTILGKTSSSQVWLQKWKDKVGEVEAARVSKEATDRGELVHSYVERYWNNEDNLLSILSREPVRVKDVAKAIINATEKCVTEVWCQEIPLWSSSIGFAGRVDMIGCWNGVPAIIDFKTSKKNKYARDIKDYYIQCTAYAFAHNELFKTDISKIVIVIGVDGKDEAQVFEQNAKPFIPDLKNRVLTYNKYEK
jgi:hypothetical protein